MKDMKTLLEDITLLTSNIETNYPELYQYLGENPITLPVSEHPQIDTRVLQEYLTSLKQLLWHHLETHQKGD
ncbi:hypothetical protein [Robiginitalea marina]|uniref:Uncharacterized protein n=1 Tax=Robiginitalea marina TaxID=2954105 RepID=A0ABT1AUJ8_9FLAO|nr:hypothetical protein [Robiginitalea marina]MCO5723282.1 hypothetical protein [Robiginitalea marina]